ncbi:alpha/beta hydrolase [Bacillus coahuilensis]|uniref:alpha/beta hydrolase n=1 Tax=Bacillus coahuilensis TaxID=408580 RepID=UPI0009E99FED|nr:alpha/beta hydrolase [Bacillus coahuilensis]
MYIFQSYTDSPKGVLVLIHGAMEYHGRYKWTIERFREEGYTVVAGDLPGHGTSSRRFRGHIDSFDEYLMEVEDWVGHALQYELPTFLFGHSMGGLVAVRYLQKEKKPIQGVILSSPGLGLLAGPPMSLNLLSYPLNLLSPKMKFKAKIMPGSITRDRDRQDSDLNDSLYLTKVSVRWYRELKSAVGKAFDEIIDFPDLPVLVLQGDDDKLVDKEKVYDWFQALSVSDKHYKSWKKCYHELLSEPEKEQVVTVVKHFLDCHCELFTIESNKMG